MKGFSRVESLAASASQAREEHNNDDDDGENEGLRIEGAPPAGWRPRAPRIRKAQHLQDGPEDLLCPAKPVDERSTDI